MFRSLAVLFSVNVFTKKVLIYHDTAKIIRNIVILIFGHTDWSPVKQRANIETHKKHVFGTQRAATERKMQTPHRKVAGWFGTHNVVKFHVCNICGNKLLLILSCCEATGLTTTHINSFYFDVLRTSV